MTPPEVFALTGGIVVVLLYLLAWRIDKRYFWGRWRR